MRKYKSVIKLQEINSDWLPDIIEKIDKATFKEINSLYGIVGKKLNYDKVALYAFCVELLQDADLVGESIAINSLLYDYAKKTKVL